jgi:AhpD family alkylhydroperoxidase
MPRARHVGRRLKTGREFCAVIAATCASATLSLRRSALEPSFHSGVATNLGEFHMTEPLYPHSSREISEARRALAPDIEKAFQAFSQNVFADGALSAKTKQLIAVAVAHVTQCPYCIRGHTKAALRHGVTRQELMEAIWVAAEMRAGGAYAHSVIALNAIDEAEGTRGG